MLQFADLVLTISQITAPINALTSGTIRLRFASLSSRHFLHSSERTEAVPSHRNAIQPFPSKILGSVGLLFPEPRRRDHRRIS